MQTILIANVAVLAASLIFGTICFFGWIKAEKKLVKHGESTLYKGGENK